MYEIVIKDYINKLTEEDIIKYGKKNKIEISFEDAKVLYVYAKNYWRDFYKGNPTELIKEIKEKIDSNTFYKLYGIYINLKEKQKKI